MRLNYRIKIFCKHTTWMHKMTTCCWRSAMASSAAWRSWEPLVPVVDPPCSRVSILARASSNLYLSFTIFTASLALDIWNKKHGGYLPWSTLKENKTICCCFSMLIHWLIVSVVSPSCTQPFLCDFVQSSPSDKYAYCIPHPYATLVP